MLNRSYVAFIVMLAGVVGSAWQGAGEQFVGHWVGTWDGAGSGGFELTLQTGQDGALGGTVSVTGEPTYKTTLQTVLFEGTRMTAQYDFPADEGVEVVLSATFDAATAHGTWVARAKAGGSELATGTWTVKKK